MKRNKKKPFGKFFSVVLIVAILISTQIPFVSALMGGEDTTADTMQGQTATLQQELEKPGAAVEQETEEEALPTAESTPPPAKEGATQPPKKGPTPQPGAQPNPAGEGATIPVHMYLVDNDGKKIDADGNPSATKHVFHTTQLNQGQKYKENDTVDPQPDSGYDYNGIKYQYHTNAEDASSTETFTYQSANNPQLYYGYKPQQHIYLYIPGEPVPQNVGPGTSQFFYPGQTYPITYTPPEGKQLLGWTTQKGGTTVEFAADATLTVGTKDIKLYAVYPPEETGKIKLKYVLFNGVISTGEEYKMHPIDFNGNALPGNKDNPLAADN